MSTFQELAKAISLRAAQIDQLTASYGRAQPTFNESGAVDTSTSQLEAADLIQVKNELINQAQDLIRLAQGPIEHVVSLSYAGIDAANFATICRLNIAQAIPIGGTISLADLAAKLGLEEDLVTRTVRYGIMNGIFTEPTAGMIGHSAASATLASNQKLHDFTLFNSGMITRMVGGISYWMEGQSKTKSEASKRDFPPSPFNCAYGGTKNFFEYMGQHPDDSREYYNFLDGRADLPRYQIDHVANNWPWNERLGNGTMIDMGGSSGHMCMTVAKVAPDAKFIVQDINPEGLSMGAANVEKVSGMKGRIEFMQHNFFEPQTVHADIYFLRHILHDWPDAECIKIIKNLEPVMRKGVRILVNDGLIPAPPSERSILLEDKQARIDDLVMMGAHLARERSIDDFRALFRAADPRWKYVGTTTVANGATFSLVEHEWDG